MFDKLREKKIDSGARHFVDLPVEFAFFDDVFEHTERLSGAQITEYVADGILDMWMEFSFRGQKFSVSNQYTDYVFFVDDPNCPEAILIEVIAHFRKLLEQ